MNLKQRLAKLEAERPQRGAGGKSFEGMSIEELTALYNEWRNPPPRSEPGVMTRDDLEAMTTEELTAFYFRVTRGPA